MKDLKGRGVLLEHSGGGSMGNELKPVLDLEAALAGIPLEELERLAFQKDLDPLHSTHITSPGYEHLANLTEVLCASEDFHKLIGRGRCLAMLPICWSDWIAAIDNAAPSLLSLARHVKAALAEKDAELDRLRQERDESRREHLATQDRLMLSLKSGDGWAWLRNKVESGFPEMVERHRSGRVSEQAGSKYEVMGWMHVICADAVALHRTYLPIALEQQKRADAAEASLASAKQEIATLAAAYERAEGDVNRQSKARFDAESQIASLKRELEEAKKDRERLDWLERWLTEIPNRWQIVLRRLETTGQFLVGLRSSVVNDKVNHLGSDLRKAIDAARSEGGKDGEV